MPGNLTGLTPRLRVLRLRLEMRMTAVAEEPVLAPNRERIRQLREARGWKTIDEAYAHAKVRGIKLSRQVLFDLENPDSDAGCRLSTLGYILRLYNQPRSE